MSQAELSRDHEVSGATPAAPASEEGVPGRTSAAATLTRRADATPSGIVMRKGGGGAVSEDAEAAVATAAGSGGHALPDDLRAKFETSLDTDLSDVRIHTGSASRAAAAAVGAQAYAMGSDIHFADGKYDPHSSSGQELLAHEVAHTVQQRGAPAVRQNKLAVSSAGDAGEIEADRAASAMVSGARASVTSSGILIARKEAEPAAAPSGQKRSLTDADRSRLANASQLLEKARANLMTPQKALEAYAAAAPGLLAQIKSDFDATVTVYNAQLERVNDVIAKAKRVYALQVTVINMLLDKLAGPVMSKIASTVTQADAAVRAIGTGQNQLSAAMSAASTLTELNIPAADSNATDIAAMQARPSATSGTGEAAEMSGGISNMPGDAVKQGAQKAAGMATDAPGASGDAGELAFYQQYAALQGKANALLPLAAKIAHLVGPLAAAKTLVGVMTQDSETRPDKSPEAVEKDAANVWNGSAPLGASAGSVTSALESLKATAQQGALTKPKNEVEIQKDLWIKWAAGLDTSNLDAMDLDVIEDHLKRLGIWDQLGIEIGDWFSDEEEALATCSAAAQARILEHKGELVEVRNDYSGSTRVTLGGLGSMPAVFESHPNGARVRASVVGGRTLPLAGAERLLLGSKNKEMVVERMLKEGYVLVVLRQVNALD